MQDKIDEVVKNALQALQDVSSEEMLQAIRVQYLGKKGELTALLKGLANVAVAEKPKVGAAVNVAKQKLQQAIQAKQNHFKAALLAQQLAAEKIDVTLKGRHGFKGQAHPITQMRQRIEAIFTQMGFAVATGPEIENDFYNFAALNIPENHPARDMQDTFYFDSGLLLRTHTSPVQIRTMKEHKVPIRIIAPGRVYRCDFDVTHTPMFHQTEGLLIDKNISFANLKAVLNHFFNRFFDKTVKLRFRASYFPFTEPSAETDISCVVCDAKGCRVCKNSGWLEVAGCGMVHPNVLKAVDIDSKQYSGFAFGMGIDRLAMLYFGVPDLRLFFENDQRFLAQF